MDDFLKNLAGGAADAVTGGVKAGAGWLSGPFKTDELMARLEETRVELSIANEALSAEEVARDTVVMDLRSMGAKAVVLNSIVTEVAVFAPPPPGPEELEHMRRTDEIYDPLEIAYLVTGTVAIATLLPKLGAGVVRMISLGKFLKNAKKTKVLMGAAKLGKATVVLAVVIFLVDTIIKMIHAKKLNEEIEAARKELRDEIAKANREAARVQMERNEAEALREEMLEESGAETVQGFLVEMNMAIKDVSEQAALVKVARNLLRMGQDPEMVRMIAPLDPEVIERIQRRLALEQALIAGKTPDADADETGADPAEVLLVQRLLTVRGDAARGFADEQLVARHAVVDAVADMQIEISTTELSNHWDDLIAAERLDTIARDMLIPEDALLLLMPEMKARGQLWNGASLEAVVAENPSVARSRLEDMAESMTADKDFAARTDLTPRELAVHLRLPPAVLGAT